jgi:hypothetical protein
LTLNQEDAPACQPVISRPVVLINKSTNIPLEEKMSKISIKRLLLSIALILLSSCIHIEPPYNGMVIDHETKLPIENVVVNMHFGSHGILDNSIEDEAYESITEKNGKYRLPAKLNTKGILEFYNDTELYFNKSGYFTTRIIDPVGYEVIELYKVRHLTDFKKYQKEASDNMSLYFISTHKDKSQAFIKEMAKIATTTTKIKSEPAYFTEKQGAEFTKVLCWQYKEDLSPYTQHNSTYAVDGTNCTVYDHASQKWFELSPQGKFLPSFNKMPSNYYMFIRDDRLNYPIFDQMVKSQSSVTS